MDAGCKIETARRRSYWSKQSNDFFNCWDHIVLCYQEITFEIKRKVKSRWIDSTITIPARSTLFVQTKSNAISKLKKYLDFDWDNKFMVVWVDRVKKPIIYYLENNNAKNIIQANKKPIIDNKRLPENLRSGQRSNELPIL